MKIAITGANGHLGRRLIRQLAATAEVIAIVRSERARKTLTDEFGSGLAVSVIDYADSAALGNALIGVDYCVHLVGIIKESKANPFADAHEAPAAALATAARQQQLKGILYLSIVGSAAMAANACLASRGRAEDILMQSGVPTRIIRVPMVLGERDYASFALLKQARRRIAVTFRADSLEQPIYAGDVIKALEASLKNGFTTDVLELAGPESLSRRALIQRAAHLLGAGPVSVVSLPLAVGMLLARLLEMLANPPVTRAMLGVLDHDDQVDTEAACNTLGLDLTPLDTTIRYIAGD